MKLASRFQAGSRSMDVSRSDPHYVHIPSPSCRAPILICDRLPIKRWPYLNASFSKLASRYPATASWASATLRAFVSYSLLRTTGCNGSSATGAA